VVENRGLGRTTEFVGPWEDAKRGSFRVSYVHSGDVMAPSGYHVSNIRGHPAHIKSVQIINKLEEERVLGTGGQEGVVEPGWEPGW